MKKKQLIKNIIIILVISFIICFIISKFANSTIVTAKASISRGIYFSENKLIINKQIPNLLEQIIDKVQDEIFQESISENVDEDIWITETSVYKSLPGDKYDIIGELTKDSKIHRIGICNNGWSQIVIEDEVFYLSSEYITTQEPLKVNIDSGDKGIYQLYALSLFSQYGWDEYQLEPLITLWNRESQWDPYIENKYSGAYGIPQALPGNKMESFGDDWRTNYQTQIKWGLSYISQRYGTPSAALQHSYDVGWY